MRKKEAREQAPNKQNMPHHIAIIMDGNGRWATRRMLPRQMGHRAGMEALKRTIETVLDLEIPVLTVYAFSTENWKRPNDEIDFLMQLLLEWLAAELNTLHEKNIQLRLLGNITAFEDRVQQEITKACEMTKYNTGLKLSVALNYGGRSEIIRAARLLADRVKKGELTTEEITEDCFSQYLFTANLPDPDLLIRTAGEMRISNFLLWQIAYSEIWITKVLWPDFDRSDLIEAIMAYQQRERRFGSIGKSR